MLSRPLPLPSKQLRLPTGLLVCTVRSFSQAQTRSFTSSILLQARGRKRENIAETSSEAQDSQFEKAERDAETIFELATDDSPAIHSEAKVKSKRGVAKGTDQEASTASKKSGKKNAPKSSKAKSKASKETATETAEVSSKRVNAGLRLPGLRLLRHSVTDKKVRSDGSEASRLRKAAAGKPRKVQTNVVEELQALRLRNVATGKPRKVKSGSSEAPQGLSLKEALLNEGERDNMLGQRKQKEMETWLDVKELSAEELEFKAVPVEVPPVPMLSYGLDRVLFNPGVYRLQDPRSRVYNFDPYLEKIMEVNQFDFNALAPYKTSSKDEELLEMTRQLGVKFTGSTSSMSGVLQHFHFLLSHSRTLNHDMLSRSFPKPTNKFSKITMGPSAIFLRWKNGMYAIDADKTYDTPNIMSWLGHSMEKLLTTDQEEFERYRKGNAAKTPPEEDNRCFHYSTQGNFLMRSQLDAHDPRLPGSGVFDLKTRAVVSIRMDHKEYTSGTGYQLRYDRGEWESFEREYFDMTRATMLKYSLQVRMGRMDGIFVAYHNIERIFGFQYISMEDMDLVLHGQTDACLGDQEFKFSVRLLDELLQKATEQYPEQTLRLHFHTRGEREPFMYVFAEPMTDEQADEIQSKGDKANRKYERDVIGIESNEEQLQEEWQDIQTSVDEKVEEQATEAEEEEPRESASEIEETETESRVEETEAESEESNLEEQASKTEGVGIDEVDSEGSASKAVEVENADEDSLAEDVEAPLPAADGPLLGWTLAIRNKVNGHYVDRPQDLRPGQEWTMEYHIKEISDDSVWSVYNKVKDIRAKLIGEEKEEDTRRIEMYRAQIRAFSNRGRRWRDQQDAIDEQLGRRQYEPMGPGSPGYGAPKA